MTLAVAEHRQSMFTFGRFSRISLHVAGKVKYLDVSQWQNLNYLAAAHRRTANQTFSGGQKTENNIVLTLRRATLAPASKVAAGRRTYFEQKSDMSRKSTIWVQNR